MTRRQQEVLDVITRLTQERGYAPSLDEIGRACGLSSTATVQTHLKALQKKGLIRWTPGAPRTLVVVPQ